MHIQEGELVADKTKKVAVAVIHGMGDQKADFAEPFTKAIQARCKRVCGDDIVIEPVYWAPVLQSKENILLERVAAAGPINLEFARKLMINYLADALAYQPTDDNNKVYDLIHGVFAKALARLAKKAGKSAPLCIVAHSLGSIITSNYIYDLQKPELIRYRVQKYRHENPLERGETLNFLYTLGSPLALWSLRFRNFGHPIKVPARQFTKNYPDLQCGWINYYDRDDVIGYPLKGLNAAYRKAVAADREVNVGGFLKGMTPLSHTAYLEDKHIINPIAESLVNTWKMINHRT